MARNAFGFETVPYANNAPHSVSPLPSPFAAGLEGDIAAVLPSEGERRFRHLRDAVADVDAVAHGLASRLVDLTQSLQRARMRLSEIKAQRVDEDHPEHIAQVAAIANASSELERLNVRIAAHEALAGPRRALLVHVADWLRGTAAGHDIVDIELVEVPKLLKTETPATAVDRLRRRLRELSADENRISSAPYPLAVAAKLAEQFIEQRAVAPIASSLIEHAGPLTINGQHVEDAIVFPSKVTEAKVTTPTGSGIAIGEQIDVVGLLCWLLKKEMTARVVEELRADADEGAALSHEERAKQLAVIKSDYEHIEAEESYWLWQAFASGTIIEPRSTMSPSAFLGVQAVAQGKRPAGVDHAEVAVRIRDAAIPVEPDADIDPGMTT